MQVDAQKIADQMVAAIEGGSNYWLNAFTPKGNTRQLAKEKPWYACPDVWSGDFEVECEIDGEEEKKILRPADLQEGINILAQKYPEHMADVMDETGDAGTGDVLLQCALLKDIVYG